MLQVPGIAEIVMRSHHRRGGLRLGEQIFSTFAYLMVWIEGDGFFCDQAVRCLAKLLKADPDGDDRLLQLPCSVTLIERLALQACFSVPAIRLLEVLRSKQSVLTAIRCLAAALAQEQHSPHVPEEAPPITPDPDAPAVVFPHLPTLPSLRLVESAEVEEEASAAPRPADHAPQIMSWPQFMTKVEQTLTQPDGTVLSIAALPSAATEADLSWPHSVEPDSAQAWSLLELIPEDEEFRGGQTVRELRQYLLTKMTLAEKRVWLSRAIYRAHRAENADDDEPIAFVECKREGDILGELRKQLSESTGLGSTPSDLTGLFEVRFANETSTGSAVEREWFQVVASALVKPESGLVLSSDGGRTFRPRCLVHPDSAIDLQILGRFLALALWRKHCVDLPLNLSFCKLLFAENHRWEVTEEEIALVPDLANKVRLLRACDVEDLELDFTDCTEDCTADDFTPGADERVDLVEGGADILVTESNKEEYIAKLCEWRMFKSIEWQTEQILSGFQEIIPPQVFKELRALISPCELRDLLAGLPAIDLDDWCAHTEYAGGYTKESEVVLRFWEAMRVFEAEDEAVLTKLFAFVTGTSRVPVGGFANLQGFNGGHHKFTIAKAVHLTPASLPAAHACICTIDIPEYDSVSVMIEKLRIAAEFGARGFDEAGAVDQ